MRLALLSTAVLTLLPVALAQDDPASTDAVYACADLADDMERLACYDTAVGRLKVAEETGEVTTISRAEIEEVQRDSFGFSIPSLPRLAMPRFGRGDQDGEVVVEEFNEISASVTRIRKDSTGKLIVQLDNGQTWQQSDTRRVYLRNGGADSAVVKKAALGSFRMKLDGGTAFRVDRVR
ncbi:MAG: hypothetical protein QNI84_15985 [Henriciella sp.]|nr:hypothetical protein [Henriciella sp.]